MQLQHIWNKKGETVFLKKEREEERETREGRRESKKNKERNGNWASAVWEVIFSIKQVCASGMCLKDKGIVQEKVVVLHCYPSQDMGNNTIC